MKDGSVIETGYFKINVVSAVLLLWGILKVFLWNMSKLALTLAFRLFDNFSNLFPKYFELLSFL